MTAQTTHSGRLILLTGATRGLGLAMARAFIAQRHTLIGCGRSRQAVAELAARFPGPHRFTSLDVVDGAAVEQWAAEILKQVGAPELLINNAAVINQPADLWNTPAADFDRVIDVNIKGVANVIRAFVPAMVEKGRGVIVNFSSGWGRSTSPQVAPYCATKWAIEGLTQAMAQELPKSMAAVALNPGIIDTDMLKVCFGSSASQYPSPEQWVKAAAPFILNLKASDNGRSLSVPGA